MSGTDKTKLNGIADSANNYSHPSTHSADMITDGTTNKAYTATEKTKLSGIATSANNYTHPNHSGDVTSSGDGATTIANSAVTLAKMANVATGTVFYRKTASTGVPEVQTLATLKTDLGLTGTNSGDITLSAGANVTIDTDGATKTIGTTGLVPLSGSVTFTGKVNAYAPATLDSSGQIRNIVISEAEPSGGSVGDIWIQYTEV